MKEPEKFHIGETKGEDSPGAVGPRFTANGVESVSRYGGGKKYAPVELVVPKNDLSYPAAEAAVNGNFRTGSPGGSAVKIFLSVPIVIVNKDGKITIVGKVKERDQPPPGTVYPNLPPP
jgi:hypothetical protein